MHNHIEARVERSARVGFATNPLDRLSERRDDASFVESLKREPSARSVVIVCDRPILRPAAEGLTALFTFAEIATLGAAREHALLGRGPAGPLFATLLDDSAVSVTPGKDDGSFLDRRSILARGRDDLTIVDMRAVAVQNLVAPELVGALGQAKSLMLWHARHRFCANCGSPTRVVASGWRRECDLCKTQHFPRTDPVAIMLAVDGEHCLLGRQARFPKGMYSCLAGFIEAGETMEAAVRREIFEEAGILTGSVAFLASQPWPFPHSLMLGCLAQATSTDIAIDTVELEDARWFPRAETQLLLAGRHPDGLACPPAMAIAHHILRAWAIEGCTP